EVEGITPARERTLDEVRDRVVADWTAREAAARLTQRAAELEKEIRDGGDFAALVGELQLELQTRRGLKRDSTDAGLGETGVAAAFGVGRGETGSVSGPDADTQVVFRVADVIQPIDASPEAIPEETRTALAAGLSDDLIDQLVARLQTQYSVSVDRNAIQQALSF